MALEDFEKELAAANAEKESRKRHREHRRSHDHRDRKRSSHSKEGNEGHRSRHSHHGHGHHQHKRSRRDESAEERHRRGRDKRDKQNRHSSRLQTDQGFKDGMSGVSDSDVGITKEALEPPIGESTLDEEVTRLKEQNLKRDAWMETPSALEVEYIQRPGREEDNPSTKRQIMDANHKRKIHEKELNHHFRDLHEEDEQKKEQTKEDEVKEVKHEVSYTFGDSGSSWRMTRLRNVYREAKESGRPVEEVGFERFGSLREFDEMREEEIELDRRKMYGKNYVTKEKPSGELFDERVREAEQRDKADAARIYHNTASHTQGEVMEEAPPPAKTVVLDATALNKLKAQMMKAKLRGAPDAMKLEEEYNAAANAAATNVREPEVIVLNASSHRMLGGSRNGEVRLAEGKRAREKGQLVENEDMSIADMVRQERRSKYQPGGEGKVLAERIAKDAKFDNNLEYLDENAAKLAQRMHKSEINLRNTAIGDLQRINRALDRCPLCYHDDTGTPPIAPVVSLATRTFLTLPTEPELSSGGALLVPIQHRKNLLECDDDEWEEIRNFMKCMIRMHASRPQPQSVIFYENAAHPSRFPHAAMTAVALPPAAADMAPAFFKEAILTSDEEWTQHVKIIDTAARAREAGMGRAAFRKSLAKEMPYFHVWFNLDGGMGHVIEDANRWPRGDLFARETLGGMLDVGPEITRRQGKWHRQHRQNGQNGQNGQQQQGDPRVEAFRTKLGWEKFDWTGVLESM